MPTGHFPNFQNQLVFSEPIQDSSKIPNEQIGKRARSDHCFGAF